jgi:hypothetical protein
MRIYKNGFSAGNTEGNKPFQVRIEGRVRPFRTGWTGAGSTFSVSWSGSNSYGKMNLLYEQETSKPYIIDNNHLYSQRHNKNADAKCSHGRTSLYTPDGDTVPFNDGVNTFWSEGDLFGRMNSWYMYRYNRVPTIESGTLAGKLVLFIEGKYWNGVDVTTIGSTPDMETYNLNGYWIVLNPDGSLFTGVTRYVGMVRNTFKDLDAIPYGDNKIAVACYRTTKITTSSNQFSLNAFVIDVSTGEKVGNYDIPLDNRGSAALAKDSNGNLYLAGVNNNGFNKVTYSDGQGN